MPRFFFDVHDDIHVIDDVGIELPDLDAAKAEATRTLAEIAGELLPNDGTRKTLAINVRNESGQVVLKTSLNYVAEAQP